jgi:hypothetical protein
MAARCKIELPFRKPSDTKLDNRFTAIPIDANPFALSQEEKSTCFPIYRYCILPSKLSPLPCINSRQAIFPLETHSIGIDKPWQVFFYTKCYTDKALNIIK